MYQKCSVDIVVRNLAIPSLPHIIKLINYLFIYEIIFFITWLCNYYYSTSDLQPSTPTVNQLPGQLVSTEIRTMYKYKF